MSIIREKMLATIPADTFDKKCLPATEENINWMFAVYAIEDGEKDLEKLLADMNEHYAGPISIHEGDCGCEADSNQELIVSKVMFDLYELECYHKGLIDKMCQLGWIEEHDAAYAANHASQYGITAA